MSALASQDLKRPALTIFVSGNCMSVAMILNNKIHYKYSVCTPYTKNNTIAKIPGGNMNWPVGPFSPININQWF